MFRKKTHPLVDKRNNQLLVYMDIVEFLKPKHVLMENVAALLKSAGGFLGRFAVGRLVYMNYQVRLGITAAGSFGLPQFRMQCFLWGSQSSEILPKFPLPSHEFIVCGGYLKCVQNNLHVTVLALLTAAVVWMSELPPKLNPVILPLMAAVKREKEHILQQKAAEALAELIFHCIGRNPSPNDKLIKNICSLTCTDSCETPQVTMINSVEAIEDQNLLSVGRAISVQKANPQMISSGEDRSRVEGFISRRGSELALKHLCDKFGSSLFDKLPKVWDCVSEVLEPVREECQSHTDNQRRLQVMGILEENPQALVNNIQGDVDCERGIKLQIKWILRRLCYSNKVIQILIGVCLIQQRNNSDTAAKRSCISCTSSVELRIELSCQKSTEMKFFHMLRVESPKGVSTSTQELMCD